MNKLETIVETKNHLIVNTNKAAIHVIQEMQKFVGKKIFVADGSIAKSCLTIKEAAESVSLNKQLKNGHLNFRCWVTTSGNWVYLKNKVCFTSEYEFSYGSETRTQRVVNYQEKMVCLGKVDENTKTVLTEISQNFIPFEKISYKTEMKKVEQFKKLQAEANKIRSSVDSDFAEANSLYR